MSRENVEVIRRMLDAWLARDYEASRQAMHPDIEWHDPADQPGGSVHRGHAGVDESIRTWIAAWDDFGYEPTELLDAGDKVLVVGRQSGRGKGSRVEVDSYLCHLWTLRDGKAVEMHMFMDRDEAFKAAGLRE